MLKFDRGVYIENPRGYDTRAVANLRDLLKIGSPVESDPRRENFYEVDGESETYYIYVSPVSGNVVLVAKWIRQSHHCYSDAGELVA